MKKFIANQGDLKMELSNNTIFIEGTNIFNGDIHKLRVWLDSVDNLLNSNRKLDTNDDPWIPEDIYGTSDNVE
jgi:hypothetical protein